jgi:hypothetical protein
MLPRLSSTWLPPDTLIVLMLHLQTSQIHVACGMRQAHSSASAALIWQLYELSTACCTSAQLHTILHFTAAAAAAPTVGVLFVSYGRCTSVHQLLHTAAVGFVHLDRWIQQPTAYTPWQIISAAGRWLG